MAEPGARPALRLDSKLYGGALRRWGQGGAGRAGNAPQFFVDWLIGHEIDQELVSLISDAIPHKPMERDGDYLDCPEGVIAANESQPDFIESGLLIIGAALGCGDYLVLDLWRGGVIGIVSHERLEKQPRDEFWPVDKSIGRCAHRLAGTWWRTLVNNTKNSVASLFKQKAGPVTFTKGQTHQFKAGYPICGFSVPDGYHVHTSGHDDGVWVKFGEIDNAVDVALYALEHKRVMAARQDDGGYVPLQGAEGWLIHRESEGKYFVVFLLEDYAAVVHGGFSWSDKDLAEFCRRVEVQ